MFDSMPLLAQQTATAVVGLLGAAVVIIAVSFIVSAVRSAMKGGD